MGYYYLSWNLEKIKELKHEFSEVKEEELDKPIDNIEVFEEYNAPGKNVIIINIFCVKSMLLELYNETLKINFNDRLENNSKKMNFFKKLLFDIVNNFKELHLRNKEVNKDKDVKETDIGIFILDSLEKISNSSYYIDIVKIIHLENLSNEIFNKMNNSDVPEDFIKSKISLSEGESIYKKYLEILLNHINTIIDFIISNIS